MYLKYIKTPQTRITRLNVCEFLNAYVLYHCYTLYIKVMNHNHRTYFNVRDFISINI